MVEKLETLRKQILDLDTEIVRLLRKRMRLAQQIGDLKKELCIPVIDSLREEQVLKHVCTLPHDPLSTAHLVELYQRILLISREMQTSLFSEEREKPS